MTAEARTGQGNGKAEAREGARERAEKSGKGEYVCLFWLLAILNVCQMLFVLVIAVVVVGFAVIVTPNSEMCNDNATLSVFLSFCLSVCVCVCMYVLACVCVGPHFGLRLYCSLS